MAGGGAEEARGLRVETTPGASEIVIYVEDPAVNEPETSRGRAEVGIECVDSGGVVVLRRHEAWPFKDTDGGTLDPHVHVGVNPSVPGRIARCRLRDTDPRLQGGTV